MRWEQAYVGRRRGTLSLATDASHSSSHFTTFDAAFRRFLDLGILSVGIWHFVRMVAKIFVVEMLRLLMGRADLRVGGSGGGG